MVNEVKQTMSVEHIAEICHEANRIYCRLRGGDVSHSPWDYAPPWQRESVIDGVRRAIEGVTPEQSHENWLKVKQADGWVFGAEKDPVRKTHPCLLPYNELSEFNRRKDVIFLAVVQACRAQV